MNKDNKMRTGVIEVLTAYILWGFLPLFWNLLDEVPAFYILFHEHSGHCFFA